MKQEDEKLKEKQVTTLLQKKQARFMMLFWAALAIVHIMFFFVMPNGVRDASWLWVAIKWIFLLVYAIFFVLALRRYAQSR